MLSSITSSYGLTYGMVLSFITAIVINRCNQLFGYFPTLYPPNLRHCSDSFRQWKWRNFSISFIHSIITGFGSLLWYFIFDLIWIQLSKCVSIYSVSYSPRLLIEVIDEYLEPAYLLTSFSHGLYDWYPEYSLI